MDPENTTGGVMWQTIESAPRDETWILLYAPPKEWECGAGQVYAARWNDISYSLQEIWAYDATHWIPLPELPNV